MNQIAKDSLKQTEQESKKDTGKAVEFKNTLR